MRQKEQSSLPSGKIKTGLVSWFLVFFGGGDASRNPLPMPRTQRGEETVSRATGASSQLPLKLGVSSRLFPSCEG